MIKVGDVVELLKYNEYPKELRGINILIHQFFIIQKHARDTYLLQTVGDTYNFTLRIQIVEDYFTVNSEATLLYGF